MARLHVAVPDSATRNPVTDSLTINVDGEQCMRGVIILILSLLAMLAGSVGFAWYVWRELGDVEISTHGYIALVAGVVMTLALGGGLMWLVYFSHRRGYDDGAGRD